MMVRLLGQNHFEGAHSASHPSLLYAVFGIILSLIMVSMAVLSCACLDGGHNKKLKKPEIPNRRIGRVFRGEIVVKTVKGYRDPFFMGGGTRGGAGSALPPPVPTGGGTATAHGRVFRGEIVVKTVKGYRDPFFMGGGTRGGAGSALPPPVPTGGGTATAHGR